MPVDDWTRGTAAALKRELRMPCDLYGKSGYFDGWIDLRKSDILYTLSKQRDEHKQFVWRIERNPASTNKRAKDRRAVVIWLGKVTQ